MCVIKYSALEYLPHAFMGGSRCGSDEQCMDVPPSTECDSEEGQEKPFCPRDIFTDIGTLCVRACVCVCVCE